jgi:hypothetical protein
LKQSVSPRETLALCAVSFAGILAKSRRNPVGLRRLNIIS